MSRSFRRKLAYKSHYWFFHIYFSHYITYPTADFHKEIFEITEDENNKLAVVVAFRGSGKSTLAAQSLPIWAMLGKLQKKFVIISSLTATQSRLILKAIQTELETNKLLINDFGPFEEDDQEWRSNSLVILRYNTRISAFSTGEAIRGIKHNQYRPDLLVCDDIEDLSSVKTKEARDKTHQWLTGEVIPAGDKNTKTIIIGNLLHEDSVICRLQESIKKGKMKGIFRKYPLLAENGKCLWQGKFPTEGSINKLRAKTENDQAWYREYLLRIVSDQERVIHPEWIKQYINVPDVNNPSYYMSTATGVDLAISQKSQADYTAMVSAHIFRINDKLKIFILPNPINQKITFPETVQMLEYISRSLNSILFIEEVGYQAAIIQQLNDNGFQAKGVSPKGQDKRSRLSLVSQLIKNGTVLFPEKGTEDLIKQLVGFGVEKHEDLVDAFTTLILAILDNQKGYQQPIIIKCEGLYKGLLPFESSSRGSWAKGAFSRLRWQ